MNNIENIGDTISNTLVEALNTIISFLPNLLGGLLILFVGWVVASLLRTATRRGLDAINAEQWLNEAGIRSPQGRTSWINIIGQLVFWTVMFVFLVPTLEAWNLAEVTPILNQLFAYLPRVIAAIVVGFIGYIVSNLVSQVVGNATEGYGNLSNVLTSVARYSILIFTTLVVLTQLGIASALIQIFFSALMFAFALATGLAFGLGGRQPAERVLNQLLDAGQTQAEKVKRVATQQRARGRDR